MQTIDIQQILKYASIVDEFSLGNDFMVGKTGNGDNRLLEFLRHPVRFNGYILFFLKKGSLTINLDLGSYFIQEHTMLISVPRNIVRIPPLTPDQMAQTELTFVLFSKEFISGLHLDFNTVYQQSLRLKDSPCIALSGENLELAKSYYQLAGQVLRSEHKNKWQVIGSLLSSLNYLTADIWEEQLNRADELRSVTTTRMNQVMDQFIALVTEYHTTERGMQFYADKLFLTPKYLSKIIKEASGQSGPDWIDAFVILEAKNMLRFSNLAIKEVVYALNFPNPSVFHKFFKAHTGMTPSEYRKEN